MFLLKCEFFKYYTYTGTTNYKVRCPHCSWHFLALVEISWFFAKNFNYEFDSEDIQDTFKKQPSNGLNFLRLLL